MRPSTSIPAIALALLQTTNALNGALQRKLLLLADMGLNPDGSTLDHSHMDGDFIKAIKREAAAGAAVEPITPEYVELPLDHFGGGSGGYPTSPPSKPATFQNRYWVAQSGYKPGGPVFIYDAGEQDASASALFRLQNETSFFKQLVDSYGGIGIVWEHRFYGTSTPVTIDLDTPPEAFRYLTTEQSLADVDRFAKQFSRKNLNYTLTPDNTPWVFVGGSYPAMRATFMRKRYPDTIYASYASSAPVEASVDQSFYFDPVWRGMNAYGFGNCTKDIQAAIRYMDDVMEKNSTAAVQLKEQFLGLGAGNNSHATFADALSTIFYVWQSYGMEGGDKGLRRFCDWIETDPESRKVAPAEGWAKTKGANWTVDRWSRYPWFAGNVNEYMTTNCSGRPNLGGDCNLDLRFNDAAMISWTWQYCTQWGYFQSANVGPQQLVSKFNSLKHQRDICHRQFPTAPRELLPEWPNTDRTNAVFGGWNIRPSNTYWSNGEFDPWRTLSPASAEPFAPKGVHLFTTAPQCNKEQSRSELFGYVIPGAQHCYDFRTYFPDGAISRKYFTDALTSWLKCYKPKRGNGGYGKPFAA